MDTATSVRVLYGQRIFLADKMRIAQCQPLSPVGILTRLEDQFQVVVSSVPF